MEKYFKEVTVEDFLQSTTTIIRDILGAEPASTRSEYHLFSKLHTDKLLLFCRQIEQISRLRLKLYNQSKLANYNLKSGVLDTAGLAQECMIEVSFDLGKIDILIYPEADDYYFVSMEEFRNDSGHVLKGQVGGPLLYYRTKYYRCDDFVGLLKCLEFIINEIKK